MKLSVFLIVVSALLGVLGQLCLKTSVSQAGPSTLSGTNLWRLAFTLAKTPTLILALFLYAAGVLLWIGVLSRTDLSFAYPLQGALSYLGVPFAASLVLRESVSPTRWLGVAIVVVGIVVISKG